MWHLSFCCMPRVLFVFVVGWSWIAVATAFFVHFARVFGLTAFYHRYFSHRAFKTSRLVQFLGAALGSAAAQRGPIWWAAHHRHHHRASDKPNDIHSPSQQGFWWSHMLWFMTRESYGTDYRVVKDWLKYPELRFLDRFDFLVPTVLAVSMFGFGEFVGQTLAIIWNQWLADAGVGVCHFHHHVVPRDFRHQLAGP